MTALGLGLGLHLLRAIQAASGEAVPASIKLKDEDSSDWYAVTLHPNVGSTGFYLDWTGPVSAGDTPEWILFAPENGIKYRWGFKVLDEVLQLTTLGETFADLNQVQIRASNGAVRYIVCAFDGGPYLDFPIS